MGIDAHLLNINLWKFGEARAIFLHADFLEEIRQYYIDQPVLIKNYAYTSGEQLSGYLANSFSIL